MAKLNQKALELVLEASAKMGLELKIFHQKETAQGLEIMFLSLPSPLLDLPRLQSIIDSKLSEAKYQHLLLVYPLRCQRLGGGMQRLEFGAGVKASVLLRKHAQIAEVAADACHVKVENLPNKVTELILRKEELEQEIAKYTKA